MLGIVCGLESEAAIARRMAGSCVAISAARADAAAGEARWLAAQGAAVLLSFGLAGGLDPDLAAGSVVIGDRVCAMDGSLSCNHEFIKFLQYKIPAASVGPIWAAESAVKSAQEKLALFRRTGCLCTDMESRAVALTAAEAGIPFAVLRAVADTAVTDLPPAALAPLRRDGKADLRRVLPAVIRAPGQIPALFRLGLYAYLALGALRRAAGAISPEEFQENFGKDSGLRPDNLR